MGRGGYLYSALVVVAVSVAFVGAGCGSSTDDSLFGGGNGGGGGGSSDGSIGNGDGGGSVCFTGNCDGGLGGDGSPKPCTGLACQINHNCAGGAKTSISGIVYDPAGKNPLYNIVVYIPNSAVKPLPAGASCECDTLFSGDPIAAAVTDADGKFRIDNVPDGTNIPLVIQVGKWRKQMTIPSVAGCKDNAQPDKSITLPKNHTDPKSDIPNIAISTGGADTLECLLSRIGLDAAEYGGGGNGAGRIHIFKGAGGPNTSPAGPASPTSLWTSKAALMAYDIVLLSCEGSETTGMNQQALHDYASAGGRVFASHFHYAWLNSGPYGAENLATWTAGANAIGNVNGTIVTKLPNNQPFPKGLALEEFLKNTNALTNGLLPIQQAKHNADVTAANTPSQTWIQSMTPSATEYFSVNTPTNAALNDAGVPNYCGRIVFSDLHVGAAVVPADKPALPVPTGCTNADLSPQEKALEFMLFDLSACVTLNNEPPKPPPIK